MDKTEKKNQKKEMQEEKEHQNYIKIKNSLNYSIKDGVYYTVMDASTSPYITPFAIALGSSPGLIAAFSSVPNLVSSILQLFTFKIVELCGKRKIITIVGSILQTIIWLLIPLLVYFSKGNVMVLLGMVTLVSAVTAFNNPVGNSLLVDLVPVHERGNFFAKRNKYVEITNFIATAVAGLLLALLSQIHYLLGFFFLFVIAAIARMGSVLYKFPFYETKFKISEDSTFSFFSFLKRINNSAFGLFVQFMTFFKFAVYISAPFFTLYMLRDLKLSYVQFTMITIIPIIARFITLRYWGKITDKYGNRVALVFTALLIPFVPICWAFTSNYSVLILVEVISGILWVGFDLSAGNFIYDATTPKKRITCASYHNFFVGIAMFAAATLSSIMLRSLPTFNFISNIPVLFVISGILRLLVVLLFLPKIREQRLVELNFNRDPFFPNVVQIKSNGVFSNAAKNKPPVFEIDKSHSFTIPSDMIIHSNSFRNSYEEEIYSKRFVNYMLYEKKRI